jgi:hypothetical protein
VKRTRQSILGRVAGYKSAASQARMRQQACERDGDTEGATKWAAKVDHWRALAAEWAAKLEAVED